MTTTAQRLLTAEDLLRMDGQGVRGELVRGVLCETMPAGYEHGIVVVNLAAELRNFVKPRRLGTVTASDSGVWLERDPDTVREPDVAYFSAEKIPLDARITGYAEVVPDLVVEIASPSTGLQQANDKALMWLRYGVRLVWVVHPGARTVDEHREGRAVRSLTAAENLHGADVLPGFTAPIQALFDA